MSEKQNFSLWHDFLKALYVHAVVILMLIVYVMLSDLMHLFYVKPSPSARLVNIEFIASQSRIQTHTVTRTSRHTVSAVPASTSTLKPKKPVHVTKQDKKRMPVQRSKQAIVPVENLLSKANQALQQQVPKKSVAKANSMKNLPKSVQRQASVVAKKVKASVGKQVHLDKAVGEKVNPGTKAQGLPSKSASAQTPPGVLSQRNAQTLGSKTVYATAKKRLDRSAVKKTAEQLTDKVNKQVLGKQKAKVTSSREQKKMLSNAHQIAQSQDDDLSQKVAQKKAEQRAAEDKATRLADEAEKKRIAEQEAAKRAEAAQAKRLADEVEAKRQQQLANERAALAAEKQRLAELEAAKRAEEAHAKQVAAEAELARVNGLVSEYGQLIIAHIQRHAVFNPGMAGYRAQLKIQLAKNGDVQTVDLAGTSGNASFDRLAMNAVYKASPLPLPPDDVAIEKMRFINLTVSPSEAD